MHSPWTHALGQRTIDIVAGARPNFMKIAPIIRAVQARRLGLRSVMFVGTVPKEQVARYWSLLDVSIIHLRATELFTTVIPSKHFRMHGDGAARVS